MNGFENFRFFPAYSIETLAEQLAEAIGTRKDPFAPETVLITNYAQRIWLQHYLARKNGICANIRFVSPEYFLGKISESDSGKNLFDRDALAWRIFKTLREIHAPGSDTPENLRFPFRENKEEDFILTAQTLTDLFWRYQSFRTEMIVAWTQGEDIPEIRTAKNPEFVFEYARQKNLWQKLKLREDEIPALRYRNFYKSNYDLTTKKLPERLFVFAPTALPKTHFEMLQKLSTQTQILFYYHNLSNNYWIESRNKKSNLKNPQANERGNELLTSWGKAARALAGGLIEINLLGSVSNGDEPPKRDSVLHCLQANIRENLPAAESALSAENQPANDSVSLRVHSAHSRMREMEILRDDLRDLTARDSSIRPRDILVMLPDVDAYAPYIRAVFENSEFPFSLADSAGADRFGGISALLSLLKIAQGEVRLSELCSQLDAEAVVRALGFEEEDVISLKKILIRSNIRWGLDADSRGQRIFGDAESVPKDSPDCARVLYNNSWAFGLRRCALGVMMGDALDADAEPLAFGANREIVPAENLPENAATLLGKFSRVLNAVKTLAEYYASGEKSVEAWCRFIKCDLAGTLLKFSEGSLEEENILSDAIDTVRRSAEDAGIGNEPVRLKTVVSMLENRSWESSRGTGMLRGKVTFCRLQPLRNIPAKAVYIAGMNTGEFPRSSRSSALDLIALWPKTLEWDRTARDEDCLLLLEAVLAAKTYLRFSYVGRSSKNNSLIPPCTPLSKLIDEVTEMLLPQDIPAEKREAKECEIRNLFCFEHSPQNPETEKLLRENAPVPAQRPPFLPENGIPLTPAECEEFAELSAETVGEFLAHPAKFVYEKRLRIDKLYTNKPPSDLDPEKPKIKATEFLQTLLDNGMETLTQSDLETQNIISDTMRDAVEKYVRRGCAGGAFPILTDAEALAKSKELKFDDLSKRSNLWSKLIGRSIVGEPESVTAQCDYDFSADGANIPQHVRLVATCEKFSDSCGNTCFVKAFPQVYSFEWEFIINAVVHAAFFCDAYPETEFTFIAFHPDIVARVKKSVIIIESSRLFQFPEAYTISLIRRFFVGLENPQPYFPGMKISAEDCETFLDEFQREEAQDADFSRKFRKFLFGDDFASARKAEICGPVFEFSRAINSVIQNTTTKKRRPAKTR